MSDKPTNNLFTAASRIVSDAIYLSDTLLDRRNGSVLYLLVIRPVAYIYAKLNSVINSYIRTNSLALLLKNTTEYTSSLDYIASNFALTRKTAEPATGTVTMLLTSTSVYIPQGLLLYIDGKAFRTVSRTVILSAEAASDFTASADVLLSVGYPVSPTTYAANVKVQATEPGHMLIAKNATILYSWNIALVISVLLLSPVSSGTARLTDALLAVRIRDFATENTTATRRSIYKRLQNSPYPPIDCFVLTTQLSMRSINNNFGIPHSGIVDAYVKIQNQPLTTVTYISALLDGILHIPVLIAGGIIAVLLLRNQQGDLLAPLLVVFGAASASLSPLLARLSSMQTIDIHNTDIHAGLLYTVKLTGMPGIYADQMYLQQPQAAFVGLSVLLHSAVPVSVSLRIQLDCMQAPDTLQVSAMRLFIASAINRQAVGLPVLNISDIDKAFLVSFPGFTLRAPCTITARIPTRNNDIYTFSSLTCFIDISDRLGIYTWPKSVYYYQAVALDIELVQI